MRGWIKARVLLWYLKQGHLLHTKNTKIFESVLEMHDIINEDNDKERVLKIFDSKAKKTLNLEIEFEKHHP